MSQTETGSFAWLARSVLGLHAGVSVATFLLGMPSFTALRVAAPLLPRQAHWPIVAGIQDAAGNSGGRRKG